MTNNAQPSPRSSPDAPKSRRPLPTPGEAQPGPVSPSSFYASSSKENMKAGSSKTSYQYQPPTTPPPPPTQKKGRSTFREPELVREEEEEDEQLPSLVPAETAPQWAETVNWGRPHSPMPWDNIDPVGWGASPDLSYWHQNSAGRKIDIDGRIDYEEENWWDPRIRDMHKRPGPGLLPPLLADMLHDPEHSLWSVSAAPPNSPSHRPTSASSSHHPPPNFTPPTADEVRTAVPHPNAYYCPEHNGWILLQWCSSTVLPPLAKSFLASNHQFPLPEQERRKKTSSCVGTDEQPFGQVNKTHHFHRYKKAVDARMLNTPFRRGEWEDEGKKHARRKATLTESPQNVSDAMQIDEKNQEEEDEEPFLLDLYVCCQCSVYCLVSSQMIPGVIPAKLVQAFTKDKLAHPQPGRTPRASVGSAWETVLTIIENRLWKGETRVLPVQRPKFQAKVGWSPLIQSIFESLTFTTAPTTIGGTVPSQPALYPPSHSDLNPNTTEGRRRRMRLVRAWVEVAAWVGVWFKNRSKEAIGDYVPMTLTVNVENAREMYQLGVGAHVSQIPRDSAIPDLELVEPLRESWEVLGMTAKTYSWDLLAFAYYAQCRCDPARTPLYFTHLQRIHQTLQMLSLSSSVPSSTSTTATGDLDTIITEELSRGRFTEEDVVHAGKVLGFGREGDLKVELDEDVDDGFVLEAWKSAVRMVMAASEYGGTAASATTATTPTATTATTPTDPNELAKRRKELNDALRIIAEYRGSTFLREVWKAEKGKTFMTLDQAYATLEVPRDIEEGVLLPIYTLRVVDQPSQADKMREALTLIAEARGSDRLKGFLETGTDPGEITSSTAQDMPRGLNQLGNTCYLNSLLQYFYTIKDLRDAIIPFSNADAKSLDDSKFSDDDLKRHRVGGRMVTRREILRSKKFVSQLAELFWNLEYCDGPAVTPTLDLAKLALVTSQDEEDEGESERTGTDGSNDTDATLVEDAPPRLLPPAHTPTLTPTSTPAAPVASSSDRDRERSSSAGSSVLGKRGRTDTRMDVDVEARKEEEEEPEPDADVDGDRESYVMVSKPPSPPDKPEKSRAQRQESAYRPEAGSSSTGKDKDVEMEDVRAPSGSGTPLNANLNVGASAKSAPPPLPPRRPREPDDSVMMFGRQHDVSECMDNCMFQIETALLDFQDKAGSDDDKTSVVKRLFYGKKRQRLTDLSPPRDPRHQSSTHEKEDLFSHLHVNVSEEGYDLYDGLSRYFDDVVEFEGSKKRMEVSLIDLPPLLQIQLQRVQFDRETQQPYKSQAYIKFGETLYLDRFMDTANPEKKARSKAIQTELNACRDRIHKLTQGKYAPYPPALGATADFLSTQTLIDLPDIDDSLTRALRVERDMITSQLEHERATATKLKEELESLWANDDSAAYELTSVFIHRGSSPSWGHYFFYSRNLPDKPDQWFKYNDSDVSIVSKDEVLADTTGSTANPYMLVFARKGSDVIQTVHRFDPESLEVDN